MAKENMILPVIMPVKDRLELTKQTVDYENHYSVFPDFVWEKLFSLTGWSVLKFRAENYFFDSSQVWDSEYRYLLKAV